MNSSEAACVTHARQVRLRDSSNAYSHSGEIKEIIPPIEHARKMERLGAGEIIINSINNDGCMNGYDINIIRQISTEVNIPVIACGGAGKLDHFKEAIFQGKASAVAAGSMFVYYGNKNGILINYPEKNI